MSKVKFPGVREVAEELRRINANVEGECDVRLCVWTNAYRAAWVVRSGDVQYDQSHSNYCGAGTVPGVEYGALTHRRRVGKFNSLDLARDLLAQCEEQRADDTTT